ncbi:MAG: transposase, partial [Pseudomonadota bacterium]
MSRYIRPRIEGATVFFTVALAVRGGTALVDHVGALRAAVRVTKVERPFSIRAFVVMPDHLHAVWTLPEGDAEYSVRWGAIKARFTRAVRDECRVGFHPTIAKTLGQPVGWNPTLRRSASKVRKGDAGLWQRRFWERHIRSEAELAAAVRYCHLNPVKHGFVERAEDWAWSSVHRD